MVAKRWLEQLRWRFGRDRDEEAARELRDHLDLEADEFRKGGLSREDSEYAARRALGNTALIREDIHAVWTSTILEQVVQDVRYAIRSLAKTPGFSVVALLTLAVGIGANIAIFTFLNAAFLKPLPYPGADRIVVLRQHSPRLGPDLAVHPRSFVHWQEQAQSFEALALAQAGEIPAAVPRTAPPRQAKRRATRARPVYSSRVASTEPFGFRPFGPGW